LLLFLSVPSACFLVHLLLPCFLHVSIRFLFAIEDDSKLLSGFPFIGHGNADNNVESPCILIAQPTIPASLQAGRPRKRGLIPARRKRVSPRRPDSL
jgi:hypothetical protein